MEFVELLKVMGVIGIPSIFAIVLWCLKTCLSFGEKMKILMGSQQAQMRNTLLFLYEKYKEQGWISNDDLENWENQYQSYHALGKNGVLDNRRTQLFDLPNRKENKK